MDKKMFIGEDKHEYCPFIREKTQQLLEDYLKNTQPTKVLEIGTFIGYSAYIILSTCPNCTLISLEKDTQNFLDAQKNLKNFESRVSLINVDALEFLQNNSDSFDFIFLDGPKGQYYKYLPYIKKSLNLGGILFADDVLFYSMVNSTEKVPHKHRSIVNNLRKFLQALQEDKDFKTQILDLDDGVSISKKIK